MSDKLKMVSSIVEAEEQLSFLRSDIYDEIPSCLVNLRMPGEAATNPLQRGSQALLDATQMLQQKVNRHVMLRRHCFDGPVQCPKKIYLILD